MRTQPGLDRWRRKLVESTDGRVLQVGFSTGRAPGGNAKLYAADNCRR